MHKGRLVVWEEELQPPVPRRAPRRTRRAAVQAHPGHRRRQRGRRARMAAPRGGARVWQGLSPGALSMPVEDSAWLRQMNFSANLTLGTTWQDHTYYC